MKISLVVPPVVFYSQAILPPLGILSIASYVREENEVEVIDCVYRRLCIEEAIDLVADADVIGVASNWTSNVLNTYALIRGLRERYPKKTIVAGGYHATFDPANHLDNGCDAVVMGEAEVTFSEMVNAIKDGSPLSKVPGLTIRSRTGHVTTGKRGLVPDLDALPMPSWDLVGTSYPSPIGRMSILETSRGCTFRCSFCSSNRYWDFSWRSKSPERVADEFAYLSSSGTQFTYIADDNPAVDPDHLARICQRLIDEGNQLPWWSCLRSDVVVRHPELVSLMVEAGCRVLAVGYESANQAILDECHKGTDKEMNRKAIKVLRDHGIITHGSLIIGFPGESEESMRETVELAMELDFPMISILRPYPGTLYEDLSIPPEVYATLNQGYSYLHEDPARVEFIQKMGALRIYLRPRALQRLASPDPFVRGWTMMIYRELSSIFLANAGNYLRRSAGLFL